MANGPIRPFAVLFLFYAFAHSWVEAFPAPTKTPRTTSAQVTGGEVVNPTCVILKVSYDGGRFTGWSSANDKKDINGSDLIVEARQRTRRVRRKFKEKLPQGFVRSVEGVLKLHLSKLFAGVDPSRVILEASSRTDKGVHADAAIVQAYVLSQDEQLPVQRDQLAIPGKSKQHPKSAFDTNGFETFRKDPASLMYVLNLILPHDVRIRGVALMPKSPVSARPFHPTLDALSKTYQYNLSVGRFHDPTRWRKCWHIRTAEGRPAFDIDMVQTALAELRGQHDFAAFRGAPRGDQDKTRQQRETTLCDIQDISFEEERGSQDSYENRSFVVTVTGDRFLYKMVRFMVGSLVAIGVGRLSVDDLKGAIQNGTWDKRDGSRSQFKCAPPHGLMLKEVEYDTSLKWIVN